MIPADHRRELQEHEHCQAGSREEAQRFTLWAQCDIPYFGSAPFCYASTIVLFQRQSQAMSPGWNLGQGNFNRKPSPATILLTEKAELKTCHSKRACKLSLERVAKRSGYVLQRASHLTIFNEISDLWIRYVELYSNSSKLYEYITVVDRPENLQMNSQHVCTSLGPPLLLSSGISTPPKEGNWGTKNTSICRSLTVSS